MSEILLDQQIQPYSNAQLLGMSCVTAILGEQPVADGVREMTYLYWPNCNSEAIVHEEEVRFLIASIVDIPDTPKTQMLAIYEPKIKDNVIDIGEFLEAISFEPDSGEFRYSLGAEKAGELCASDALIYFIVRNRILQFIARLDQRNS